MECKTEYFQDRKQNSSLEESKHANQEFRSAYQLQLMNVLFNHLVKFGNQLDQSASKR